MQSLFVAAGRENFYPVVMPNFARVFESRSSASASTTASSRSTSPTDEDIFRTSVECWSASSKDVTRCVEKVTPFDDKGLGHAYPEGLIVRNTFIDFEEESFALDMRKTKSEPPKSASRSTCALTMERVPQAPHGPAVLHLASILEGCQHQAPILAIPNSKLGSPEMPTIGSANHHLRDCKPCAFFWKPAGCTSGIDCAYCHLCDSNERKRRQKERKSQLKTKSMMDTGA